MPVHMAEDPLGVVAISTGAALEHFDLLGRVMLSTRKLKA